MNQNQTQTIGVPSSLLDNIIQYIEVSSLTTKRSVDENDLHRQSQKRAADLRGPLLEHMLKNGVVAEHQKQAADAMLGSHAETLQLLKAAVDKIAELKGGQTKKAGDLGEAVDPQKAGVAAGGHYVKQGEYNSLTSPLVGHKTAYIKESDKALLALIGK